MDNLLNGEYVRVGSIKNLSAFTGKILLFKQYGLYWSLPDWMKSGYLWVGDITNDKISAHVVYDDFTDHGFDYLTDSYPKYYALRVKEASLEEQEKLFSEISNKSYMLAHDTIIKKLQLKLAVAQQQ